jgi:N-acetylglutamate synthase-like GNAT family acetyltransferase
MTQNAARQIAKLLNEQNMLPAKVDESQVRYGNYFYIDIDDNGGKTIIACVQVKQMSFFSYELKHLSVHPDYTRRGLAAIMISLVENYSREKKIPILMATSRTGNAKVNPLFEKVGYHKAGTFLNPETGNSCYIWQKNLN